MKIIETIQGAVQNTVIYLDGNGEKKVVTRPSVCKIEDIIADIRKGETPEKTEEPSTAQETVLDAPGSDSDALSMKEGVSGHKAEPSARGTKK